MENDNQNSVLQSGRELKEEVAEQMLTMFKNKVENGSVFLFVLSFS
jgi:hypothetical protein